MRRLTLALLVAALLGCATAPAPKFVGNSYHNNKYKFSLEKPAGWEHFEIKEIPKQLLAEVPLLAAVPPDMRKAVKIVLMDSGPLMIIAADRVGYCLPQHIPMMVRTMQEGLVASMKAMPEVDDIKYCSGVHLTEQDACIEMLNKEGGFRMSMLMKFYSVGSQANMLMVLCLSPEDVYDDHFPAFLNVVNSLRCGDEYGAALSGSATLKPEREVVDNILSSTYPKLKAKVDASLTYLGDLQYSGGGYDAFTKFRRQTVAESHVFVFVTAEEAVIKKALIIRIVQHRGTGTWVPDQTSSVKNKLDDGDLRLAGNRFQYYSKVVRIFASNPIIEYVYNRGYSTHNYALWTQIVRVVGSGKILIAFDYLEDISDSRFGYMGWRNKDALYDEQKNRLDVCKKHCLEAFEILK